MRLIDADKLKLKVQRISTEAWMMKINASVETTLNQFIDYVDEAPTIDIEPKRGEWKPFDLTWGRSIWYCTACEESTEVPCDIWKHKPIYKYCPNCGARMKGADDE